MLTDITTRGRTASDAFPGARYDGSSGMNKAAFQEGFTEIEHKFALNELFDLNLFRESVLSLNPRNVTALEVRDAYYILDARRDFIFRHRYDQELQHLTAKSFAADTEIRTEINLDLGQHKGDQQETVDAFFEALGVAWKGIIYKAIEVYNYPDCEIVYYEAWRDRHRRLRFVEFEAKNISDRDAALTVIERYKGLTGFEGRPREKKALVEIFFPELACDNHGSD